MSRSSDSSGSGGSRALGPEAKSNGGGRSPDNVHAESQSTAAATRDKSSGAESKPVVVSESAVPEKSTANSPRGDAPSRKDGDNASQHSSASAKPHTEGAGEKTAPDTKVKAGDAHGGTTTDSAKSWTEPRWRRVDASLLGPVWPGTGAFLKELLPLQQTWALLKGFKSPEPREPYRVPEGSDLPLRPRFGQEDGKVKPLSRNTNWLTADERPEHLYKVDSAGNWSKVSSRADDAASVSSKPGSDDAASVSSKSDAVSSKTAPGSDNAAKSTDKSASNKSEAGGGGGKAPSGKTVVGEGGGTSEIPLPRTGPLLKRWANQTAPVMRTVVGDHEGNWYISDLPHESFHNAGVYVAFKAAFEDGRMTAIFDDAGAYRPAPGRIRDALKDLYNGLDHYDQHWRKYTEEERNGWPPAAERNGPAAAETQAGTKADSDTASQKKTDEAKSDTKSDKKSGADRSGTESTRPGDEEGPATRQEWDSIAGLDDPRTFTKDEYGKATVADAELVVLGDKDYAYYVWRSEHVRPGVGEETTTGWRRADNGADLSTAEVEKILADKRMTQIRVPGDAKVELSAPGRRPSGTEPHLTEKHPTVVEELTRTTDSETDGVGGKDKSADDHGPNEGPVVHDDGALPELVNVPRADLERMTPQQRARAIEADRLLEAHKAKGWSDVPIDEMSQQFKDELMGMLKNGTEEDALIAAIEMVRHGTEGKVLRWHQISGLKAWNDVNVLEMAAGEGKSITFVADVMTIAARKGSMQYVTTSDLLAKEAETAYLEVAQKFGFKIVRMDSNTTYEPPKEGEPTIYVGTQDELMFGILKGHRVPGAEISIDEYDQARYHKDSAYILADAGVKGAADQPIRDQVNWARDFIEQHTGTDDARLTMADFATTPGDVAGQRELTPAGREKIEKILQRPLQTPDQGWSEEHRLAMAAVAKWQFRAEAHYTVDEARRAIYIIDPTTHGVMRDARTSNESRWNNGLAQAIEAKHDLIIRNDVDSSKTAMLTSKEVYENDYAKLKGATGTADTVRANEGESAVERIARFRALKLQYSDDVVAENRDAKHDLIAEHVVNRSRNTGRPELVLANDNSEVEAIAGRMEAMGLRRGIDFEAIDAKRIVALGEKWEEQVQAIVKGAGGENKILITNRMGARGVDIKISAEMSERNGLSVSITSRSAESRDFDIQAENRTARDGQNGSVQYYISPDDALYAHVPEATTVRIKYEQAAAAHRADPDGTDTKAALADAEHELRQLREQLQPIGTERPRITSFVPPQHSSNHSVERPPVTAEPVGTPPPVPDQQQQPPTDDVQQPISDGPAIRVDEKGTSFHYFVDDKSGRNAVVGRVLPSGDYTESTYHDDGRVVTESSRLVTTTDANRNTVTTNHAGTIQTTVVNGALTTHHSGAQLIQKIATDSDGTHVWIQRVDESADGSQADLVIGTVGEGHSVVGFDGAQRVITVNETGAVVAADTHGELLAHLVPLDHADRLVNGGVRQSIPGWDSLAGYPEFLQRLAQQWYLAAGLHTRLVNGPADGNCAFRAVLQSEYPGAWKVGAPGKLLNLDAEAARDRAGAADYIAKNPAEFIRWFGLDEPLSPEDREQLPALARAAAETIRTLDSWSDDYHDMVMHALSLVKQRRIIVLADGQQHIFPPDGSLDRTAPLYVAFVPQDSESTTNNHYLGVQRVSDNAALPEDSAHFGRSAAVADELADGSPVHLLGTADTASPVLSEKSTASSVGVRWDDPELLIYRGSRPYTGLVDDWQPSGPQDWLLLGNSDRQLFSVHREAVGAHDSRTIILDHDGAVILLGDRTLRQFSEEHGVSKVQAGTLLPFGLSWSEPELLGQLIPGPARKEDFEDWLRADIDHRALQLGTAAAHLLTAYASSDGSIHVMDAQFNPVHLNGERLTALFDRFRLEKFQGVHPVPLMLQAKEPDLLGAPFSWQDDEVIPVTRNVAQRVQPTGGLFTNERRLIKPYPDGFFGYDERIFNARKAFVFGEQQEWHRWVWGPDGAEGYVSEEALERVGYFPVREVRDGAAATGYRLAGRKSVTVPGPVGPVELAVGERVFVEPNVQLHAAFLVHRQNGEAVWVDSYALAELGVWRPRPLDGPLWWRSGPAMGDIARLAQADAAELRGIIGNDLTKVGAMLRVYRGYRADSNAEASVHAAELFDENGAERRGFRSVEVLVDGQWAQVDCLTLLPYQNGEPIWPHMIIEAHRAVRAHAETSRNALAQSESADALTGVTVASHSATDGDSPPWSWQGSTDVSETAGLADVAHATGLEPTEGGYSVVVPAPDVEIRSAGNRFVAPADLALRIESASKAGVPFRVSGLPGTATVFVRRDDLAASGYVLRRAAGTYQQIDRKTQAAEGDTLVQAVPVLATDGTQRYVVRGVEYSIHPVGDNPGLLEVEHDSLSWRIARVDAERAGLAHPDTLYEHWIGAGEIDGPEWEEVAGAHHIASSADTHSDAGTADSSDPGEAAGSAQVWRWLTENPGRQLFLGDALHHRFTAVAQSGRILVRTAGDPWIAMDEQRLGELIREHGLSTFKFEAEIGQDEDQSTNFPQGQSASSDSAAGRPLLRGGAGASSGRELRAVLAGVVPPVVGAVWESQPGVANNCLWHALARALDIDADDAGAHRDFRDGVVRAMLAAPELYVGEFMGAEPSMVVRVRAFVEQLKLLLTPGDSGRPAVDHLLPAADRSLPVAAEALGLNLDVYFENGFVERWRFGVPGQRAVALFRAGVRDDDGHYWVAVGKSGEVAGYQPVLDVSEVVGSGRPALRGGTAAEPPVAPSPAVVETLPADPAYTEQTFPSDDDREWLYANEPIEGLTAAEALVFRQAVVAPTGDENPPPSNLPVVLPAAMIKAPDDRALVRADDGQLVSIPLSSVLRMRGGVSSTGNVKFVEVEHLGGVWDVPEIVLHEEFEEVSLAGRQRGWRPKAAGIFGVGKDDQLVRWAADSNVAIRQNPLDPAKMDLHLPEDEGWLSVGRSEALVLRTGRAAGDLYRDGRPRPEDVIQGNVGSCYLLSNLIGLATSNPHLIHNMIHETGTGESRTFKVRFYAPETNSWVWVEVDNTFYTDPAGQMIYAVQDPSRPLWPAVIEKAWAVFRGRDRGYLGIDGGQAGETAARLRPPRVPGFAGRVQSTHHVDDPLAEALFQLDVDAVADLVGSQGFARMFADWNGPQWRTELVMARMRVMNRMKDEDLLPSALRQKSHAELAEVLGAGLAAAVGEALLAWRPEDETDSAIAFVNFLNRQWGPLRQRLSDHLDAWESVDELPDTRIAQWVAERIDYLLHSGDTVSLGTKADIPEQLPSFTLSPQHAYAVVRVDRIRLASGSFGLPTAVVLRNPHGGNEFPVDLKYLNLFDMLRAAGPGTRFAYGVADAEAGHEATSSSAAQIGARPGIAPNTSEPAAATVPDFFALDGTQSGALPRSVAGLESFLTANGLSNVQLAKDIGLDHRNSLVDRGRGLFEDPGPRLAALWGLHDELLGPVPADVPAAVRQLTTMRRLWDILRSARIADRSAVTVAHLDTLLDRFDARDGSEGRAEMVAGDRRMLLLDVLDKAKVPGQAISPAQAEDAYRRWCDQAVGTMAGGVVTVAGMRSALTSFVALGENSRARGFVRKLGHERLDRYHAEMVAHLQQQLVAQQTRGSHPAEVHQVPTRMNFAWFGGELSPAAVANVAAWVEAAEGSDWTVTLWSESGHDKVFDQLRRHPELGPLIGDKLLLDGGVTELVAEVGGDELVAAYRLALRTGAFNLSSDIARYAVLVKWGGVYADVDIAPGTVRLAELPPMRLHEDDVPVLAPRIREHRSLGVLGIDPTLPFTEQVAQAVAIRYNRGEFGNQFLVAPPNSRYLRDLMTAIPEKLLFGNPIDVPGTPFTDVQRVIQADPAELRDILTRMRAAVAEETITPVDTMLLAVLEHHIAEAMKVLPNAVLGLQELTGTADDVGGRLTLRAPIVSGPMLLAQSAAVHGSLMNYAKNVLGLEKLWWPDVTAMMDPRIVSAFEQLAWLTDESEAVLDQEPGQGATSSTPVEDDDAVVDLRDEAPEPDRLAAAVDTTVDLQNLGVERVVWRTTSEPLYRSSNSSPNDIFDTGFAPPIPEFTDLRKYVLNNRDSVFVGTSKRADIWEVFPRRYVYEISVPGGIDVNATLALHDSDAHSAAGPHDFHREEEIALPGGIRREFIVGAFRFHRSTQTLGQFFPNPNYGRPHAPQSADADELSIEQAEYIDYDSESDVEADIGPVFDPGYEPADRQIEALPGYQVIPIPPGPPALFWAINVASGQPMYGDLRSRIVEALKARHQEFLAGRNPEVDGVLVAVRDQEDTLRLMREQDPDDPGIPALEQEVDGMRQMLPWVLNSQIDAYIDVGTSDSAIGDVLVRVAADELGFRLIVVNPDGSRAAFGPMAGPEHVLMRVHNGSYHYHAATRIPLELAEVRSAAASNLNEIAGLTDSVSRTPSGQSDESTGVEALTPGSAGGSSVVTDMNRSGEVTDVDRSGALPDVVDEAGGLSFVAAAQPTPTAGSVLAPETAVVMPPAAISIPGDRLIVPDRAGNLVVVMLAGVEPRLVGPATSEDGYDWRRVDFGGEIGERVVRFDLLRSHFDTSTANRSLLRPKHAGAVLVRGDGAAVHFAAGTIMPVRMAGPIVALRDPADTDPATAWHPLPADTGMAPSRRTIAGDLFGADGPTATDVRQGDVGTCYLHADLISLVRQDPTLITDMVVEHLDGTWSVRFYRGDEEVWVPVDRTFYTDSAGRMSYAAHLPGQPLWPAVIEKAWAVHRGGEQGYAGIDAGRAGDTAANLRPAMAAGSAGRVQPTRSVDDPSFAHPMGMGRDALAEVLGSEGFAHAVLDVESEWRTEALGWSDADNWDRAQRHYAELLEAHDGEKDAAATAFRQWMRDIDPRGATGTAQVLRRRFDAAFDRLWQPGDTGNPMESSSAELSARVGSGIAHALIELVPAWRAARLDGAEVTGPAGLRAFLDGHFDQWTDRLTAQLRAWEAAAPLADTRIAAWVADRLDYALRRTDIQTLGTRRTPDGKRHAGSGLSPQHAYAVVRVERDAAGNPTGVLLRDPNGGQSTVPLRHFNQFDFLSTSGAGARGMHGLDAVPTTGIGYSRMVGQPQDGAESPTEMDYELDTPADIAPDFMDLDRPFTAVAESVATAQIPAADDGSDSLFTAHELSALFGEPIPADQINAAAGPDSSSAAAPVAAAWEFVESAVNAPGSIEMPAAAVYLDESGLFLRDTDGKLIRIHLDTRLSVEQPDQHPDWYEARFPDDSTRKLNKRVVELAFDIFGGGSNPREGMWLLAKANGHGYVAGSDNPVLSTRSRPAAMTNIGNAVRIKLSKSAEWESVTWVSGADESFIVGRAAGPLYGATGPRPEDVRQGGIADCYLLADLIGLAEKHPEWIKSMIHEHGDDTFSVRFRVPDGWRWVRVNRDFYRADDGSMMYAVHEPNQPLWAAIVEKAWAVHRGKDRGYAGIHFGRAGRTAATLWPEQAPGFAGRTQPTRSIDDVYFAHPLTLERDAMAELLRSDGFAHAVLDTEPAWRARLSNRYNTKWAPAKKKFKEFRDKHPGDRAAAKRELERWLHEIDPRTRRGTESLLQEYFSAAFDLLWVDTDTECPMNLDRAELSDRVGAGMAHALDELRPVWRAAEREGLDVASPAGLRDFLDEEFRVRTVRLIRHMRAWASDTALVDTTVAAWLAERIDYALRRGDTVVLGSRARFDEDSTHPETDLSSDHSYTAVEVRRNAKGRPAALVLRDPYGPEKVVLLRRFNQFKSLSSTGPGTYGMDILDETSFVKPTELAASGSGARRLADTSTTHAMDAGSSYEIADTPGDLSGSGALMSSGLLSPAEVPAARHAAVLVPDRPGSLVQLPGGEQATLIVRARDGGAYQELVLLAGMRFVVEPIYGDSSGTWVWLRQGDLVWSVTADAAAAVGLRPLRRLDGPAFRTDADGRPRPTTADLEYLPMISPLVEELRELVVEHPASVRDMVRYDEVGNIEVLLRVGNEPRWVRVDGLTDTSATPAEAPVWPALVLEAHAAAEAWLQSAASSFAAEHAEPHGGLRPFNVLERPFSWQDGNAVTRRWERQVRPTGAVVAQNNRIIYPHPGNFFRHEASMHEAQKIFVANEKAKLYRLVQGVGGDVAYVAEETLARVGYRPATATRGAVTVSGYQLAESQFVTVPGPLGPVTFTVGERITVEPRAHLRGAILLRRGNGESVWVDPRAAAEVGVRHPRVLDGPLWGRPVSTREDLINDLRQLPRPAILEIHAIVGRDLAVVGDLLRISGDSADSAPAPLDEQAAERRGFRSVEVRVGQRWVSVDCLTDLPYESGRPIWPHLIIEAHRAVRASTETSAEVPQNMPGGQALSWLDEAMRLLGDERDRVAPETSTRRPFVPVSPVSADEPYLPFFVPPIETVPRHTEFAPPRLRYTGDTAAVVAADGTRIVAAGNQLLTVTEVEYAGPHGLPFRVRVEGEARSTALVTPAELAAAGFVVPGEDSFLPADAVPAVRRGDEFVRFARAGFRLADHQMGWAQDTVAEVTGVAQRPDGTVDFVEIEQDGQTRRVTLAELRAEGFVTAAVGSFARPDSLGILWPGHALLHARRVELGGQVAPLYLIHGRPYEVTAGDGDTVLVTDEDRDEWLISAAQAAAAGLHLPIELAGPLWDPATGPRPGDVPLDLGDPQLTQILREFVTRNPDGVRRMFTPIGAARSDILAAIDDGDDTLFASEHAIAEADPITAGHYAILLEVDSGPIRYVIGRDSYPGSAAGSVPGPDQPIWPWLLASAYRHALHDETVATEEEFANRRGFVEWWNADTTGEAPEDPTPETEMPGGGGDPGPSSARGRPLTTDIVGPDHVKRRRTDRTEDDE
ncbi:C2 family cysteine protease [Nocardia sp. NPDC051052]|uniref:C2 family cysteine protease n=1 Tax=Nocardia sp. NPDC051052 TaxID=3364322 RepID=UPI00378DB554